MWSNHATTSLTCSCSWCHVANCFRLHFLCAGWSGVKVLSLCLSTLSIDTIVVRMMHMLVIVLLSFKWAHEQAYLIADSGILAMEGGFRPPLQRESPGARLSSRQCRNVNNDLGLIYEGQDYQWQAKKWPSNFIINGITLLKKSKARIWRNSQCSIRTWPGTWACRSVP